MKMLQIFLRQNANFLTRSPAFMTRMTPQSQLLRNSSNLPKDTPNENVMTMANNRNFNEFNHFRKNGIKWFLSYQGSTGYRTLPREPPVTSLYFYLFMTVVWTHIIWTFFHDGVHFVMHPFSYEDMSGASNEDLGLEDE